PSEAEHSYLVGDMLPVVSRAFFFEMLTIQAHVLGKGLGQKNIVALLDEISHRPSVPINVTTCKSL
ncbi:hypothetical protein DNTS_003359, partial [Danionella cerebrum]